MSRTYRLERSQLVSRPLEEVFAFFADAANLERITPGFLSFRILTEQPLAIQPGTLIDYRLRLFGLPLRWRTRIDEFEPLKRFVDTQLKGPYKLWRHQHDFYEKPDGTLVVDRVDYQLPLGPLGSAAHAIFVRRTLGKIFDHRQKIVAQILGEEPVKTQA